MSRSAVSVAQCCARTLHTSPRPTPRASLAITQCQRRAPARRRESTAAASSSSTNPKISTIVDQISQLTLLETADLVSNLKVSPLNQLKQMFHWGPPLPNTYLHHFYADIYASSYVSISPTCHWPGSLPVPQRQQLLPPVEEEEAPCSPRKDALRPHIQIIRRRSQAQGHKGDKEYTGIKFGG